MKKNFLMVLFIACLSVSCEKQQTSSKDEQQLKNKTSANDLSSSQEITERPKPEAFRLVYEIKDPKDFTTTFSEANGEMDDRYLYLFESKKINKHFLIKSPKQIDFNKDLINKKFVNDLSFTDNLDNTYSCKILSKKKNQTSARPGVGEPGQLCIDWYWIIFNEQTGEIIAEVYVNTTCYDNSGSGGGGGGGSSTDCSNLTEQGQNDIINSLQATDPEIVEYDNGTLVILRNGLEQKPRTPKWRFAKITGLLFIEYEWTAYFSGVIYRNNDQDFWKWQSLDYSSNALTDGVVLPCTSVDMNVTSTSITISADKKEAYVSLAYVANFTIFGPLGGKPAPVWGSNSKTFTAN